MPRDAIAAEVSIRESLKDMAEEHGFPYGQLTGPNDAAEIAEFHLAVIDFLLEVNALIPQFSKQPKEPGELESNPAFPSCKPKTHLGYSGYAPILFSIPGMDRAVVENGLDGVPRTTTHAMIIQQMLETDSGTFAKGPLRGARIPFYHCSFDLGLVKQYYRTQMDDEGTGKFLGGNGKMSGTVLMCSDVRPGFSRSRRSQLAQVAQGAVQPQASAWRQSISQPPGPPPPQQEQQLVLKRKYPQSHYGQSDTVPNKHRPLLGYIPMQSYVETMEQENMARYYEAQMAYGDQQHRDDDNDYTTPDEYERGGMSALQVHRDQAQRDEQHDHKQREWQRACDEAEDVANMLGAFVLQDGRHQQQHGQRRDVQNDARHNSQYPMQPGKLYEPVRRVAFAPTNQQGPGRKAQACFAYAQDLCHKDPNAEPGTINNCPYSHDEQLREELCRRISDSAAARANAKTAAKRDIEAARAKTGVGRLQAAALPPSAPPERIVSAIMSRRDGSQGYGDGAGSAGRADSDSVEVL
jgi:hypothetical protein